MRNGLLALVLMCILTPRLHAVTPAELEANPLWMPESASVKVDLNFTDGAKVKAGEKYKIYQLKDGELRLWFPNGKSTFSVTVDQSSLIADAEAALEKLTPAQRELSPRLIAERQDIWPLKVKLGDTVTYDDGSRLSKGAEFTVTGYDGQAVQVFESRKNMLFNVNPAVTDFFARCMENVESPKPSRLYQELAGSVVNATTLEPFDFLAEGGPEYLAVYYAAAWCPYCAQTSPEVMKWYEENEAREKKRIEMVLVSRDKSRAELSRHIESLKFRSSVVPFDKVMEMIVLRNTPDNAGLPYLFVVDRAGNVVLQSLGGQPMDRTQDMLTRMRALQAKLDAE